MNAELIKKLKSLKPARGFYVVGDTRREEVLRTAKALYDLKQIPHKISTHRVGKTETFTVKAI